jgi:hypothetical protein
MSCTLTTFVSTCNSCCVPSPLTANQHHIKCHKQYSRKHDFHDNTQRQKGRRFHMESIGLFAHYISLALFPIHINIMTTVASAHQHNKSSHQHHITSIYTDTMHKWNSSIFYCNHTLFFLPIDTPKRSHELFTMPNMLCNSTAADAALHQAPSPRATALFSNRSALLLAMVRSELSLCCESFSSNPLAPHDIVSILTLHCSTVCNHFANVMLPLFLSIVLAKENMCSTVGSLFLQVFVLFQSCCMYTITPSALVCLFLIASFLEIGYCSWSDDIHFWCQVESSKYNCETSGKSVIKDCIRLATTHQHTIMTLHQDKH